MQNFESYLMEQYFREENPLDDESVEGFDDWIADIDPNELIDYANKYCDLKIRTYEKLA